MFNKDTEYAVIIIRELKLKQLNGDGTTRLSDIVASKNIKQGFAEQVCRRLKSGGLIKSVKGPGGGYEITDEGTNSNLMDIMKIAEPRLTKKVEKLLPESVSLFEKYEKKMKQVYI